MVPRAVNEERILPNNHSYGKQPLSYQLFPSGRVQLGHESGRKERHAFATRLSRTARNPFPWMSETIDLGKEKNFFESRVTEYLSGASLSWD